MALEAPLLNFSDLRGLSSPTAAPGPRRPKESHTTSVGSRIESDEPDT